MILVQMGMADGIEAVRALAGELPDTKILVVGVPDGDAIAWLEAGAAGCVTPEASLEEVITAVHRVQRGEAPSSPRMTAILIDRVQALAAERAARDRDARLTPREEEIIALIDKGLSNRQIAESLCIEQATVKNHVHNILQKLGVDRRGEAAAAVRDRVGRRHVNLST